MQFRKDTCDYTEAGRELVHTNLNFILKSKIAERLQFTKYSDKYTIEYYDNRISLFSAQNGQCSITKEPLKTYNFHCHHKIPKKFGGGDNYQNLTIVKGEIHDLIHAVSGVYIAKLLDKFKLSPTHLAKVNKYRELCKLELIEVQ